MLAGSSRPPADSLESSACGAGWSCCRRRRRLRAEPACRPASWSEQVVVLLAEQRLDVVHAGWVAAGVASSASPRRAGRTSLQSLTALPRVCLPADGLLDRRPLGIGQFVLDRHAVGAVEDHDTGRAAARSPRCSCSTGSASVMNEQREQEAAADCRAPAAGRAAPLAESGGRRRATTTISAAAARTTQNSAVLRPRRSERRVDLVDRRDVLDAQQPAQSANHDAAPSRCQGSGCGGILWPERSARPRRSFPQAAAAAPAARATTTIVWPRMAVPARLISSAGTDPAEVRAGGTVVELLAAERRQVRFVAASPLTTSGTSQTGLSLSSGDLAPKAPAGSRRRDRRRA